MEAVENSHVESSVPQRESRGFHMAVFIGTDLRDFSYWKADF